MCVELLPPVTEDTEPGPDQQQQAEAVKDDFVIIVQITPSGVQPAEASDVSEISSCPHWSSGPLLWKWGLW